MIPFNKPFLQKNELDYIVDAHNRGHLAGDGFYTKKCNTWLLNNTEAKHALLTHSCTAALEISAILLEIKPGDEVIFPSYTFVSTANAFVLRGAVPVFVDIDINNLCIDINAVEKAITSKTKAVVPVHYAGISCDMDKLIDLCLKKGISIVEDAAQSILSYYKGKHLGSFGEISTLSFHETKNITSGEGGALLINNEKYSDRAEIIREKGTNRSKFFRGQVDKYTWVDLGSSYLPSDLNAAVLFSQMEYATEITKKRLSIWNKYNSNFKLLEEKGLVVLPKIPTYSNQNGHMFYLVMDSLKIRTEFISFMLENKIMCVFHYIPLHSSPAGIKYGRQHGSLEITNRISETLVRLPLWVGVEEFQDLIIGLVYDFFKKSSLL